MKVTMESTVEEYIEQSKLWVKDPDSLHHNEIKRLCDLVRGEIGTLDRMVNDINHFIENVIFVDSDDKVAIYNLLHDVLITRREYKDKESILSPFVEYTATSERLRGRGRDVDISFRNRLRNRHEKAMSNIDGKRYYSVRVLTNTFGSTIMESNIYYNDEFKKDYL